jgi:quinoprotein glucose dehydrogenase
MWKDRIAKARNEGLFTPPGLEESLSLPGGRGGSNWGTSAADPEKGIVYLTTQDWPTLYTMLPTDPLAARRGRGAPAAAADPGAALYTARCLTCHGLGGAGAASGGTRAIGGASRMALDAFRQIVRGGRADMPAFADLTDADIAALHTYLGNPGGTGRGRGAGPAAELSSDRGPVVASGGAPGASAPRTVTPRPSPLGGPPYPTDVSAPSARYYTDWGLFPNHPYVIGPPWSQLVAYDLNAGTIKWRVPLGEDAMAAREGAKNTGAFDAQHHGLVVTSTGLLFVATTDGKLRAYDTDNGAVLWTRTLLPDPRGCRRCTRPTGGNFSSSRPPHPSTPAADIARRARPFRPRPRRPRRPSMAPTSPSRCHGRRRFGRGAGSSVLTVKP